MEGFWLRAPPEPEFLNVYGAQELISRNQFCSLRSTAGQYDNPIPTRFLDPIEYLKIPAQPVGINKYSVEGLVWILFGERRIFNIVPV
jgi:hypothetical protein